jgi:TetR/AcrR family transcriptional repressor of nem operon
MNTKDQIIKEASNLCQSVGVNGFSFGDLAKRIGIKTSSIHYYFPQKDDLSIAMVNAYREELKEILIQLELRELSPKARLFRFIDFLEEYLPERVCLCGMLAAEVSSQSEKVKYEIKKFLSDLELWIQKTLTESKRAGELARTVNPQSASRFIACSLQGLLICSRAFDDKARFRDGVKCIHDFLKGDKL